MKKISISGEIGWDTTANDLKRSLESAGGEDVEITISSPGGYVSDALEMFNLLRNYSGHVTAILSGFAMSAASYIPLAADKVVAEDNAVFMIHNAGGGVFGDHNDILHYGKFLKGLSTMLTKAYSTFSGKSVTELEKLMDDTTYFYGDQIADAGFAHGMVSGDGETDQESNMSVAKLKFQEVSDKLIGDQAAMKKDLSRASAMAFGEIKPAAITPQQEDSNMDLKELKAKHPDLVASIIEEATAGHDEALVKARAEGAAGENDRIKSVHAQMFPGQEEIVNAAMFDGKSQAGDVAIAINAANIEAQAKAGEELSGDAPVPVSEPPAKPANSKSKLTESEKVKAAWDASAKLREEFEEDFEAYAQYAKAAALGKIRTKGEE